MISILCIYTLSLRGLEIIKIDFGDPSIVSAALMLIVSFFVYGAMIRTQLPLTEFGLTTTDWKKSMFEGIIVALILFVAMLLIKLFAITYVSKFSSLPLFEFDTGLNRSFQIIAPKQVFILVIYIVFSPVQEFLVRGGLQGSLYCFLSGTQRRKNWVAIIVSNLIFVTFHSHISILFALMALIPGIAWGWLYSRHKTLIGVVVSHLLLGILGIFILGITNLVGTTGT
jgi:membrane protease YdiL (CAAX protease family)